MPDDFLASISTSGAISVNSTVSGEIETIGDHDWFVVQLSANQTYRVEVTGLYSGGGNTLADPFLRGLYGPDGVGFVGFTYDDQNLETRSASYDVTSGYTGTHYISVSGYGRGTGTYSLSVSDSQQDDDFTRNALTQGSVSVGGSASGTHEAIGDEDWFAVNLNAGTRYGFELLGSGTGTAANSSGLQFDRLYDAAGVGIFGTGSLEGENATTSSFPVESYFEYVPTTSGTYFVSATATGSNTGTYQLNVTDLSIGDDYADDASTTGFLAGSGVLAGAIETRNDVDWFAVSLVAGQSYDITVSGVAGALGPLENSQLGLLSGGSSSFVVTGQTGDDASIRFLAPNSGLFYFEVLAEGSDLGNYTFTLDQVLVSDDHSNNATSQSVVSISDPVQGIIETPFDLDFFSVNFEAGHIYQIDLTGPSGFDTVINGIYSYANSYFVEQEFNLIPNTSNDDFDALVSRDSRVTYSAAVTGEYFISAGGFDTNTGVYDLLVSDIGLVADDYSNDIFTSGALVIDGSTSGVIETETDEDWFAATLTQGVTYTFEMDWGFGYEAYFERPALQLFTSTGAFVRDVSIDNPFFGPAALTFTADQGGQYFLSVGSAESQSVTPGSGAYTLSLSDSVVAITDDFASTINTTGSFSNGESATTFVTGNIETDNDVDWFAVDLIENHHYDINLKGAEIDAGTLQDPFLVGVFDDQGIFRGAQDDNSGEGQNAFATYIATYTGTHYFAASHVLSSGTNTGTYVLQYDDLGSISDADTVLGVVNEGVSTTFSITFEDIGFDRASVFDWDVTDLTIAGTAGFSTDYTYTYVVTDDALDITVTGLSDELAEDDESISYLVSGYVELILPSPSGGTATLLNVDDVPVVGERRLFEFDEDLRFTLNSAPNGNDPLFVLPNFTGQQVVGNVLTSFSDTESDSFSVRPIFFDGNISGEIATNGDVTITENLALPGASEFVSFEVIDERGAVTTAFLDLVNDVLGDDYLPGIGAGSFGALTVGATSFGSVEDLGDRDHFNVTLEAGRLYSVAVDGAAFDLPALLDPTLIGVITPDNAVINGTADSDSGAALNAFVDQFSVDADGVYQVSVAAENDAEIGSYSVLVTDLGLEDDLLPGTNATEFGTFNSEGFASGEIENDGDRDRFNIDLQAGEFYAITLRGSEFGDNVLADPAIIGVFDPDGQLIVGTSDDDGGVGEAEITPDFQAVVDGTYQIEVGSSGDFGVGEYTLAAVRLDSQSNTVLGTSGDDRLEFSLFGTERNDEIFGFAGRDNLIASIGDDTLDGGPGVDLVTYDQLAVTTNGLFINNTAADIDGVTAFTADKGSLGTDLLVGIEEIVGSQRDDVIYVGGTGFNYTLDRAGNDIVFAPQGLDVIGGNLFLVGSGNDTLVGNSFFDTIAFEDRGVVDALGLASQGAVVDLAAGTATDQWGFQDVFSSIEGVLGSEFGDSIFGDEAANVLDGQSGADVISGLGGDDSILAGLGDDTVTGGEGADLIVGRLAELDGDVITDLSADDCIVILNDDGETIAANLSIVGDFLLIDTVGDGTPDATMTLTNGYTGPAKNVGGPIGANIVLGTDGDDSFEFGIGGTNFDDHYFGLEGDDHLFPSEGNDTLDGGPGEDVAIYDALFTTEGVFINNTDAEIDGVAAFTVDKGSLGIDVLIDIENFHGTNSADVLHIGGIGGGYTFDRAGDDQIFAPQGVDVVDGVHFQAGSGNDQYFGNVFFDAIVYLIDDSDGQGPVTQGVAVNLAEQTATDPWGFQDTFVSIDGAHGTDFADTFIGANVHNYFNGYGGNDLLIGGTEHDNLVPGLGLDTITGGGSNDRFIGQVAELDGDIITDLSEDDCFQILDADENVIAANIDIVGDTLTIDTDGDGIAEATLRVTNGYTGPVKSEGGRISFPDDFSPGIAQGRGVLEAEGTTLGVIETEGDIDEFEVFLNAGVTYQINLRGADSGAGTLLDPFLNGVFDTQGNGPFSQTSDDDAGVGFESLSQFTPAFDGTYVVSVSGFNGSTGSYGISIGDLGVLDDFAADTTTQGAITAGTTQTGRIDFVGDADWFEANMQAGRLYEINLSANGDGGFADLLIDGIYDSAGNFISGTFNDGDEADADSVVVFSPEASGTYYFGVGGFFESRGGYALNFRDVGENASNSFNIDFDLSNITDPGERQKYSTALEAAAARWENVITSDLPFGLVSGQGFVDDIVIEILIESNLNVANVTHPVVAISQIDERRDPETGQSLGLPISSRIIFDQDRTEVFNLSLDDLAANAIGRALGLGLNWDRGGQVAQQDGVFRYVGPNALREFQQYFGTADGEQLLEKGENGALANHYWRESLLGSELMTPLVGYRPPESGARPPGTIDNQLSGITVGALEDLGYQVNYSAAEPFRPPSAPPAPNQIGSVVEETLLSTNAPNAAPPVPFAPSGQSLMTLFSPNALSDLQSQFSLTAGNTTLINADGQTALFTEGATGQNYLIELTGIFAKNTPQNVGQLAGEVETMEVFSIFGERLMSFDWSAKAQPITEFLAVWPGFDLSEDNAIVVDALPGTITRINPNGGGQNDSRIFAGDGDDQIWAGATPDVLVGETGNDTILAHDGNDSAFGGPGEDIIFAHQGDDTLNGGSGADFLIGGDGVDYAAFSGNRENYVVSLRADGGVSVTDRRANSDGTDQVEEIEFLNFADRDWQLELFANVATLSADDFSAFVEMYIAYYNRAPDAEGLFFWGSALSNGLTLERAAEFFFDSAEAQQTYPDVQGTPDNAALTQFAKDVYSNVLGRDFDPAGLAFWSGQLESGAVTLPSFLLEIIKGAKAPAPDGADAAFRAQKEADVAYLTNKTDLGVYFSAIKGMSDTGDATSVMSIYDGSDASIALAKAQTDAFFDAASDPVNGAFLVNLVGVLDDPYADSGLGS